MALHYYDFEIDLKWTEHQRVSVYYKDWDLSTENPNQYKDPINIEDPDPVHMVDLCSAGKQIAEFLFPTKVLQDRFRALWQAKDVVRLRLCYTDAKDTLNGLSPILWEYAYLSKYPEDEDKCERGYLLGLRDDISIVHCIEPIDRAFIPIGIQRVPVKMSFFSYFGQKAGDPTDDNKILKKFIEKYDKLTNIFQCSTLDNPKSPQIKDNPAVWPKTQETIKFSIQNEHLIQLTGHCETDKITLGNGEVITTRELETPFKVSDIIDLKAVILPCCNSADDDSIAMTLHKLGVPVVIGMSRTIQFSEMVDFVDGFYQALTDWPGEGLERAIVEVRKCIFNKEGDLPEHWPRSFGLPRLFLNGSDSVLIPEGLLFGSLETMVNDFDINIRETGESDGGDTNLLKLRDWIMDGKNAWYLITGPAATGKTTLIERLLYPFVTKSKDNPENLKIIYHFCQMNDAKTSDPMDFIVQSLVPQLVKHYGEAYKQAISPGEFPLLVKNELQSLEKFVIKPLTELGKTFPRPVIIIDGLHVVDHNYSILDLLIDNQGYLEDVARFIITADSDDPDYPSINLDEPEPAEIEENPEIAQTVLERIYRLTNHRDGKADLPIEKPEQPPLALFVDVIDRFTEAKNDLTALLGGPPPEKIDSWQELYNFFGRVIKAKKEKHGDRITDLLSIVTVAYEPFRMSQVAAILKTDTDELRPLFDLLQPFFENYSGDDPKLILYHDRIKKHLLQERDWWHGRNLNEAHEDIVEVFRPPSGNWADVTDWGTLAGANWSVKEDDQKSLARYVRRYLVHHAYYSCYYTSWEDLPERRRRARAFLNLICDSGFRNARLNQVSQREALQDLWLGLRVINAEYIYVLNGKTQKKTRIAFDRLLAAQQPNSYRRNELIRLEEALRLGQSWRNGRKAGWEDLFGFLGWQDEDDIKWWQINPGNRHKKSSVSG